MFNRFLISAFFALYLVGCAAKPLLPSAQAIVVSKMPAADSCVYLGEVQGSQGNFWTAEFTSDADLVRGARNELRNHAAALHANYVQVETEVFSNNTADDSLGGTYAAVVIGNAYKCREIQSQELVNPAAG